MAAVLIRYITLGRSLGLGRVSTGSFCRRNHQASRVSLNLAKLEQSKLSRPPITLLLNNIRGGGLSSSQISGIHALRTDMIMPKFIENNSRLFTTSSTLLSSSNADQSNGPPLIYEGKINTMVKILKGFSVTTSIMGFTMIPITLMYSGNTAINIIISTMAMFTIFTPLLLHYITKGYVTRIYFDRDTDTYTVHTYSIILQRKTLQFTPDDVEVPAVRNIFTSILAKGKSLLIDDSAFFNPNDMLHLKGFDKLQGDMTLEQLKELYLEDERKQYESEDEDEEDVKRVKKK